MNRDTTLNGASLLRPRRIALVAGLGSLALLAGAFLFQFAGGLQPCPLCIWQRWPHAVAGVLGLIALATPLRPIALLGLATTLLGAGIAGYHTGVEQGWWQGLAACSAPDIGALSSDELFDRIMSAPVARCDEIPWSFLGLSMAAWNGLLSLGLAGLWAKAYASSSASQ